MQAHRLFLLAQSPVLRYGIRGLVEASLSIEDTAEADNALQAAEVIPRFDPSLVIVQDALAGVTGISASRVVHSLAPTARIAVLTDVIDKTRLAAARASSVDVLLESAIEPDALLLALRELTGEIPSERDEVVGHVMPSAPAQDSIPSGQELAVLDGVVRNVANEEIARQLRIGDEQLMRIFASLTKQLDAYDRTTIVLAAARRGFVDLSAQLPVAPMATAQPVYWTTA